MRKTQFPIVKLVRKLRILSFLTHIPTFLRIVGNSAARGGKRSKEEEEELLLFAPPPPWSMRSAAWHQPPSLSCHRSRGPQVMAEESLRRRPIPSHQHRVDGDATSESVADRHRARRTRRSHNVGTPKTGTQERRKSGNGDRRPRRRRRRKNEVVLNVQITPLQQKRLQRRNWTQRGVVRRRKTCDANRRPKMSLPISLTQG